MESAFRLFFLDSSGYDIKEMQKSGFLELIDGIS